MAPRLELRNVAKSFTMHLRDGIHIPVVSGVSLVVELGEWVVDVRVGLRRRNLHRRTGGKRLDPP